MEAKLELLRRTMDVSYEKLVPIQRCYLHVFFLYQVAEQSGKSVIPRHLKHIFAAEKRCPFLSARS